MSAPIYANKGQCGGPIAAKTRGFHERPDYERHSLTHLLVAARSAAGRFDRRHGLIRDIEVCGHVLHIVVIVERVHQF